MPPDDQQLFNLLQLRLSRTEMFLKEHNGTTSQDFFHVPGGLEEVPTPTQDSFRDEVAGGDIDELARSEDQFSHRTLSSQLRNQGQLTHKDRPLTRRPLTQRATRANGNL